MRLCTKRTGHFQCSSAGGEAPITLDVGDEHAGFVEVGVGVLDYYNSVHGERESGGA